MLHFSNISFIIIFWNTEHNPGNNFSKTRFSTNLNAVRYIPKMLTHLVKVILVKSLQLLLNLLYLIKISNSSSQFPRSVKYHPLVYNRGQSALPLCPILANRLVVDSPFLGTISISSKLQPKSLCWECEIPFHSVARV